MSMRIVNTAISTEQSPELHEARLLLLLLHAHDRGTGSIDGIMKLAKLDFLLRYPKYLEDLLNKTRKRPVQVPMHSFETETVESKMIRFRYGPWDPRYRQWIALLCAKGLVEIEDVFSLSPGSDEFGSLPAGTYHMGADFFNVFGQSTADYTFSLRVVAVPEPTTLTLLALAAPALIRARRSPRAN